MHRAYLPLGLVVVLVSVFTLQADEKPAKASPKTVRLIADLGSPSFEEREQASRALDELGAVVLPHLHRALKSDDPEVCRRAAELIEAIELRAQTQRLLQKSKIRLSYKDVKVTDAVADLARRTGNNLQVSGAVGNRKVTLDTGDLTYWEALAKLCDAAGLHEKLPDPSAAPREARQIEMVGRGRRVMFLNDSNLSNHIKSDGPIVLEDGKGPAPATAVHGALRVRALTSKESAKGGQMMLVLEFKLEASVSWEALSSVRIDKAVDDRGQVLEPTGLFVGKQQLMPAFDDETILIVDGEFQWPTNRGQRLLPIGFRTGKKPSKTLSELRGTVGAWVRTPVEELLRVEDPAKAIDKVLHGTDGATIKLMEFTTRGQVHQLRIEMMPPVPLGSGDLSSGPLRIVFMPRPDGLPKVTVSDKNGTNPFTLLDARGQTILLSDGSYRSENATTKRIYTLTYQSGKDQGLPARLIYRGSRNAFVEVPFVLKDVPLAKAK
jgi:hypothetical protein